MEALLGMHWVQSPRSVAKFLHVVMNDDPFQLRDPETAILLGVRYPWNHGRLSSSFPHNKVP